MVGVKKIDKMWSFNLIAEKNTFTGNIEESKE
jgi:hypothetical protein